MARRDAVRLDLKRTRRLLCRIVKAPESLQRVRVIGKCEVRGVGASRDWFQVRQGLFRPPLGQQRFRRLDRVGHRILFTPANGSSSASSSEKPKWAKPAFISGLSGAVTLRVPPAG